MNRREFVAGLVTGVAGSLAGCRGSGEDGSTSADEGTPTPTPAPANGGGGTSTPADGNREAATPTARERVTLAETGTPANICETSVVEGFNIREIVDPVFDSDWTGYDIDSQYLREEGDEGLADEATVVGLEHEGLARAYPVSVLWHHEIVNDRFGGPLLVTYCSICRSGMVAERLVDGEATMFGVSGQLWRPPDRYIPASEKAGTSFGADRWGDPESTRVRDGANLVMYDELTGSFWSQAIARGICGPAAGTDLTIRPSELTTWGEWRADHPDGDILLPPPHSLVDLD